MKLALFWLSAKQATGVGNPQDVAASYKWSLNNLLQSI